MLKNIFKYYLLIGVCLFLSVSNLFAFCPKDIDEQRLNPIFYKANTSVEPANDISLQTHDWWTSDHLHMVITVTGKMPDPNNDQAKYFLNFKNQWVIEAEGFINHKLKNHSLKIVSMTAGESEINRNHTLDVHIVMEQVPDSKRDKSCNIMAFIYTTASSDKDIEKSCLDKLNEELKTFKKDWKPIVFFRGFIKNGNSKVTHRTHWEAVIGVK